ncbi:MAG: hypothetical protein ACOY3M_04300 [Patescibacteria group bacterium]
MNTHDTLAKGLLATFAGSNAVKNVTRGTVSLMGTETTVNDATYIDQWLVKRTGAGQEIAVNGGDASVRSYAGGIVPDTTLLPLGITAEQIIATLKSMLQKLGETTRLTKSVAPVTDGDWTYAYRVTDTYPEVSLAIGVETIVYKGTVVFVHAFLLADVT